VLRVQVKVVKVVFRAHERGGHSHSQVVVSELGHIDAEGLLMRLMVGYERKEIGEKWGIPSVIFLNAI
jgi:hypothetical protein